MEVDDKDNDEDTTEDEDMDDDDCKAAALNMDDVLDNDRYDNEDENVAQSTIAEVPSIVLPSFPPPASGINSVHIRTFPVGYIGI
jgi:hypothetical protein